MSHPYRMQLASSSNVDRSRSVDSINNSTSSVNSNNASSNYKIIPHQILAKQQLSTNTKKSHPFLQQLPSDVTRSLESLKINNSNSVYSNNKSNSSSKSTSPIKQSFPNKNKINSIRGMLLNDYINTSNNSNDEMADPLIDSTVSSVSISDDSMVSSMNAREDLSLNKTKLDKNNDKYENNKNNNNNLINDNNNILNHTDDQFKEISNTDLYQSNNLTSSYNFNDNKDINITNSFSKPLITPDMTPELTPELSAAKNQFFTLHKKTKSTANILHPVVESPKNSTFGEDIQNPSMNDKNQDQSQYESIDRNINSNNRNESVSLLPIETSIELYRKNAEKTKNPEVLFSYAQILIRASLSKNKSNPLTDKEKREYLNEACSILKKSSKLGYIEAQYYLGDAYSVGLFDKNSKPDLSKSLSYFEAAGKARHAESAYRTAICYKKGWGCTRDARKVVRFLEIAAMNNHPVAMMEYGIYSFHGLMGLSEDVNTKKQGISWLRRATECATELSCGAPYELSLIYMNGFKDIVIADTNYAIKLLFKAANLGHAKSASMLGKFYEIGEIVEPNSDLSIHFYNLSANLGDVDGILGLCSWYFVGSEHLEQDYNEAFAWALRAAELYNHPKAMALLQRFYELGVGCEKNLEKSKYWGDLAKKQKDKIEKASKNKKK